MTEDQRAALIAAAPLAAEVLRQNPIDAADAALAAATLLDVLKAMAEKGIIQRGALPQYSRAP